MNASHGVALLAPRPQRRQHRLDVVFHEQHVGDDDIAPADVGDALLKGLRLGRPVGCGMNCQRQSGAFMCQGLRQRGPPLRDR